MTSGDQTDFPGPQIKVTGDALIHSTELPSTQADWGQGRKRNQVRNLEPGLSPALHHPKQAMGSPLGLCTCHCLGLIFLLP